MDIDLIVDDYTGDTNHSYPLITTAVLIPYVFLQSLAFLTGVVGNTLVIAAIANEKSLRTTGNMFIVNLAIADLLVTGFVDPLSITGALTGETFFIERPVLCRFIGAICIVACLCSLFSLGVISFDRYIHICHHVQHGAIFTKRNGLIMCFFIWLLSFLFESPNLYGWGGHIYDKKQLMCLLNRSVLSYSIFFVLVGVIFPMCVIMYCYVMIFVHVSRQKAKVQAHATKSDPDKRKEQESTKLARTLFAIFMLFVISWLPFAIVSTVDVNDEYPMEVHLFTIMAAHTNSCLNSLIYGVTNKRFRRAYRRLLCPGQRTAEVETSMATKVSIVGNTSC